jgi:hypothetical protein
MPRNIPTTQRHEILDFPNVKPRLLLTTEDEHALRHEVITDVFDSFFKLIGHTFKYESNVEGRSSVDTCFWCDLYDGTKSPTAPELSADLVYELFRKYFIDYISGLSVAIVAQDLQDVAPPMITCRQTKMARGFAILVDIDFAVSEYKAVGFSKVSHINEEFIRARLYSAACRKIRANVLSIEGEILRLNAVIQKEKLLIEEVIKVAHHHLTLDDK